MLKNSSLNGKSLEKLCCRCRERKWEWVIGDRLWVMGLLRQGFSPVTRIAGS